MEPDFKIQMGLRAADPVSTTGIAVAELEHEVGPVEDLYKPSDDNLG